MLFNVLKTASIMFISGVGILCIAVIGFRFLMKLASMGAVYYFSAIGIIMLIVCIVIAYCAEKDKIIENFYPGEKDGT